MLSFCEITLENIGKVSEYLGYQNYGMCDYTAPTIYMWRHFFDTEYAVCDGMLFLRHKNFGGSAAYLFPVGKGDKTLALEKLCQTEGENITFCIVPREEKDFLIEFFEKKYGQINIKTQNDISWNDYVYLPENILGFPGKKLHGQKNHLNFFNKNFPECRYVPLDSENALRVRDFVISLGVSENADSIEQAEYTGTLEYLLHYRDFPMSCGGFLELDGKIIAAAIAERQGEYLIIHTEKADKAYRGAYQKIFDELLRHELTDRIKFVNREEDCGDEGIRYSKNAYHPEKLIKKYTVCFYRTQKEIS